MREHVSGSGRKMSAQASWSARGSGTGRRGREGKWNKDERPEKPPNKAKNRGSEKQNSRLEEFHKFRTIGREWRKKTEHTQKKLPPSVD